MEFAYNNSYKASIQMAPYEAFYERKFRSLVCWDDIDERKLLGTDLIMQTVERVAKIRKRMKVVQNRQKKWVDAERRPLEFAAGDHAFLKISPTRGGSLGSAAVGS